MEEINLEKIYVSICGHLPSMAVIKAMKLACEITIDACVENAIAQQLNNRISVNSDSILIVKNRINSSLS